AVDRRGEHLLVGGVGVHAVGPSERKAVAAEHGDATGLMVHSHILAVPAATTNAMSDRSPKVDGELHIELHEALDQLHPRKDFMTDRYQDFVSSSLGQLLVKNLGLPNPV